ncbi:ANTAR domain-containing protein [Nocardia terpenica]|uniref:ANTAR domain-containing protein n=1 Tax=Nocardia terpenica TaxID=455432 RepID=UPI002FE03231
MSVDDPAAARFVAVMRASGFTLGASSVRGDQLCTACLHVLPAAEAAITLAMPDDRWEVLGAVGETAVRFSDAQAATGEGPGPDAHDTGMPTRVIDFDVVSATGRWPLLSRWDRVDLNGAVCSVPLRLGGIRVGFLDLLGADRIVHDAAVYNDALQVAAVITTMLLATLTQPTDGSGNGNDADLGPWWDQAASTREIHQATGMIAVQLDCTVAVAYSRLVAHTFTTERTLGEIAAEVVARRLRFPPEPEAEPIPKPET